MARSDIFNTHRRIDVRAEFVYVKEKSENKKGKER